MAEKILKGKNILVVDDEEDIRHLLSYNLEKAGVKVQSAPNGKLAVDLANSVIPDMVLLDIMLPDIDGVEVCERLRSNAKFRETIIVMISARSEDYSQIAAYQVGADDYIIKPVRMKVLLKKLEVLLKRKELNGSETVRNVVLDKENYVVKIDKKELLLPKKEFELLTYLMENSQTVCKRDEILRSVWPGSVIGDRTIDVHIRKLREKIGKEFILTLKGVGYKFNASN